LVVALFGTLLHPMSVAAPVHSSALHCHGVVACCSASVLVIGSRVVEHSTTLSDTLCLLRCVAVRCSIMVLPSVAVTECACC